jgi:hypothetical protein
MVLIALLALMPRDPVALYERDGVVSVLPVRPR